MMNYIIDKEDYIKFVRRPFRKCPKCHGLGLVFDTIRIYVNSSNIILNCQLCGNDSIESIRDEDLFHFIKLSMMNEPAGDDILRMFLIPIKYDMSILDTENQRSKYCEKLTNVIKRARREIIYNSKTGKREIRPNLGKEIEILCQNF